jgi:large subunit ribosomal protein L18
MDKTSKTYLRNEARQRRRKAIQKKIYGTSERPRLVVFRSIKNISAQIIDDEIGKTLISYSSIAQGANIDRTKKKTEQSFEVGKKLGELAIGKGIKKVCFDRGGYLYHGRVKALADGARKAGLEF